MSGEDDSGEDSRWRVHLEWMFENQPEFVRELHVEGKLREHLDGKYQQALGLVAKLTQEGGLDEDEAFEVAMSAVLAPADGPALGDDPPEPVPWQEQEEILRALWPDD